MSSFEQYYYVAPAFFENIGNSNILVIQAKNKNKPKLMNIVNPRLRRIG
jgi:hypothetical protein